MKKKEIDKLKQIKRAEKELGIAIIILSGIVVLSIISIVTLFILKPI